MSGYNNPYFNRSTIHNREMFFGRADLLRCVYETLAHRRSLSIVGPRSIGKSSFLWHASQPEVQTLFPFDLSRHILVLLDIRTNLKKTGEDFFHHVSMLITAQGAKLGLTLYNQGKAEDEFSSILDQVRRYSFFPVLLLDTFDKVIINEHFDSSFFEFLRLHTVLGLVAYVTASIAPLSKVCHDVAGAPFFDIFKNNTYNLESLKAEEANKLIKMPAEREGISFEDDANLVLRLAGRHPYFIQGVCYLLFEQKQTTSQIDKKKLEDQSFKELSSLFEEIWNQLSKEQQMQLQYKAQKEGNWQCELPELSESGLFRQFVCNACRSQFFQMTTYELEKALDKIDDPVALGETTLRLMNVVSQHLKQDTFPSLTEIGMAIHEILEEALKSLHGTGMQTDSAPDWTLYNILYYGYFNQHLKKEQVAARLGMSMRQYSPERKKAIKVLRNTLFDMENASTLIED
jgi:hypothetical protein